MRKKLAPIFKIAEYKILLAARLEEKRAEIEEREGYNGLTVDQIQASLKKLRRYPGDKEFQRALKQDVYLGMLRRNICPIEGTVPTQYVDVYNVSGYAREMMDAELKRLGWLEEKLKV